ncbi:MAG: sigma-70 family RNA polymerase sigma factor [Planctomycetes bacterium]|nr:sigma-70 family RNA polymerase sigma factor [Planctomycetota bacterium]
MSQASPLPHMMPREDRGLVRAALRAEPAARAALAERMECIPRFLFKIHVQRGRRVPASMLEDLAQTTSAVVLEKLEEFRGDSRLETWIYRTCWFQYLAHEKIARRRRPALLETESLEAQPSNTPVPIDELTRSEVEEALAEAIAHLEPEQRELLEQRHFDGLGFQEIAVRLCLPVGTLKNRYYRVLSLLREELERGARG